MNGAAADVDRLRAARAWPLPLPALVIIVLLGVVGAWLFGAGLLFIANWWQQDEYSHGWLIPPLVAFILWQRRRRIWAERAPGSWTGVALVTLGLALLLLGEAAVFKRLPALGLVPVLMGLGLAWLGPQAMRHVWVPLAFLFFAMPLPGSLYVPLSMQLQLISSELGAAILQLLGVSVLLDGNVIDLGVYKLQVAEACSGLRYLFPLAAFGFLCAWLYKAPLWARAFVFLATGPITIVMNSVRIAITGLFVEHGSIALAEGFMHLFEGWVIFLAALAVLFALMWLLARIRGQRGGLVELLDFDRLAGAHIPPAPRTTTPAAVPAPLLVCVLLLLLAVPAKAAVAGREQLVPERPGLVTFPLAIDAWQGVPLPLETAMLAATGADDHLLADYAAAALHGAGVPVNLWIAYYDEQIRDAAIHSPKDCLPGGGWEYVSFREIDAPVTTSAGRSFKINRGLIANGQEQMLVYYWLDMRGRQLTRDIALKFYNLHDSLTLGRSDGALVRLITPLGPGESEAVAEARLASFMTAMYPALEPHVGG